MTWMRAAAVAAMLGGCSAVQAQTAQSGGAPGSLAEASSFFKAPRLDGCALTLEELLKGKSSALRGRWIMRKGPGEMGLAAAGRVEMLPLPQRTGDVVSLDFRNGRLVADSPVLGFLPVAVQDRAPPEPGTGLRAASVGRGDLPDSAEVFLDEIALGPLPCGPEQLLRLNMQASPDTGTGDVLRQEYRLYLIDQSRISGIYRETGAAGRLERGLVTLWRR
ncbi:hypothetical protein [Leisingera thetidis]|uniref:hypothetical protein n=1 Tax=Leisingera thetidis TaxID=2930199 RepID=UPI0021F6D655|nr:hypothetical protein [Leisingera thetidis]